MRKSLRVAALTVLGLWTFAADARADGYVSPFVGVNFGGDAGGTFREAAEERQHLTYGFSAGGMGAGVFGVEFDLGYTSNFYGNGSGISDNSVLTAMPALIIGIPIGGQQGPGIRPYATAGLGLIRRSVDLFGESIFDGNKLGYSLGGGVMGYFATNVGIRADYRYFRNVEVDDITEFEFSRGTFDFSRASVGILFRF
jgi:opacity protein-like surface antigen